jgi:hypothetical protein
VTNIRKYLNEHGIPTRTGKLWTDGVVRSMLCNPAYDKQVAIGRRKCVTKLDNGLPVKARPRSADYEIYEGRHPRMIDHDTYEEAQSYLGLGKPKLPESYGIKNPLAGIIVCGECKKRMLRRPATNPKTKGGAKYDMVICTTEGCPTVGCSLDTLEHALVQSLGEWVAGYELKAVVPESKVPELEQLLENTEKERLSLLSQKDNLYDLLEQGVYSTETFLERSHVLQERISDIDGKILSLQNEIEYERQNDAHIHNFIPACKGLLSCYWDLSVPERNHALKILLDSVEYKKYTRNRKGCKEEASFDLTIKPRIPRI